MLPASFLVMVALDVVALSARAFQGGSLVGAFSSFSSGFALLRVVLLLRGAESARSWRGFWVACPPIFASHVAFFLALSHLNHPLDLPSPLTDPIEAHLVIVGFLHALDLLYLRGWVFLRAHLFSDLVDAGWVLALSAAWAGWPWIASHAVGLQRPSFAADAKTTLLAGTSFALTSLGVLCLWRFADDMTQRRRWAARGKER
jgi:hypothetical protein